MALNERACPSLMVTDLRLRTQPAAPVFRLPPLNQINAQPAQVAWRVQSNSPVRLSLFPLPLNSAQSYSDASISNGPSLG